MNELYPRYKPNGDSAILIEFNNQISEKVNCQVQQMAAAINRANLDYIDELVPTYRSLCVYYDACAVEYYQVVKTLQDFYDQLGDNPPQDGQLIEIPVCYETPYALDLEQVAAYHGLTDQQVIDLHSAVDYRIYMLGFAPGFPYLGGLDRRIATPRLATPRRSVAAGSVGIAGDQTGIYSLNSPAGWQIIGRTPLQLYDAKRSQPILLKAGDYLRFCPISAQRFAEIEALGADYQIIKRPYLRDQR